MNKLKNFEFGNMLKKLKDKDLFFVTNIIYCAIILLYELFYCNFEFFTGIIKNYNFSIYRIIIYCFVYAIFYKFNDKLIKAAVDTLENKFKCCFIYIIFLVTAILISFGIIYLINIGLSINIVILFISLLIFNLFALYISNNIIKNVIITSLLLGNIFSISVTFNNQLDEKIHFLSSYSIAVGDFKLSTKNIDKNILDMPRMMKTEQFIKYFVEKPNGQIGNDTSSYKIEDSTCNYMTATYFVSGFGIFVAKMLGGSIADIYITGRMCNLLAYTALIALTIKVFPYKKYIIYSIFLMPMLLALASVYSADGIGTALIALFIAYCFNLKEKENVNIKEMLILILLLSLAIFAKSVGYIAISIVILILPLKKIINQNRKYIKYIIPIFIIALVSIIFIYKTNINAPGDERAAGTDTRQQFEFVLNNPINYCKVLLNHTINTFSNLRGMSFLNAPMFFSNTYYELFIIMAIYLLFISITDSSKQLDFKDRIIFIVTFFVVFAMTSTAMYLSYTKVGANFINGHQMRYIFPTLFLLLSSISIKKFSLEDKFKYTNMYIAYPMAIFLIVSVLDLTII